MLDILDIPARYVYLNGHAVTETLYEGKRHLFDPHYEFFFLNWNNKNVASVEEVLMDRSLLERTFGMPSRTLEYRASTLAAYTLDYSSVKFLDNAYLPSVPMNFTLWPSESLTYHWELVHEIRSHKYPELTDYADPSLVATLERPISSPGTYEMSAPSLFVGGELDLDVVSDSVTVSLSLDGISWNQVGLYPVGHYLVSLDSWVDKEANPEIYKFYVKLVGNVAGATLRGYFQVAYQAMPVLRLGTNELTVDADSAYELGIQLQWKETSFTLPPGNISSPIYPLNGQILSYRPSRVTWSIPVDPDGDPVVDYEVIVSDDPLCRWPVSPNFERLLSISRDAGTHSLSFDSSFLNSNQKYYWKVRAQDGNGIWGGWSPIFEFRIESRKSNAVIPSLMLLLDN